MYFRVKETNELINIAQLYLLDDLSGPGLKGVREPILCFPETLQGRNKVTEKKEHLQSKT